MYIKIFLILFNSIFLYTTQQSTFNNNSKDISFNNIEDIDSNILKIYLKDQSYHDINLDDLVKNMQNVFHYLKDINSPLLNDQAIKMLFDFNAFFLTFNGRFDNITNNYNYNVNLQKFIKKMLSKDIINTKYNEYLFLIIIINDKNLSNLDKYFKIEQLFLLHIFEDDENYTKIEKIIKDENLNNTQKYKKIELFIKKTLINEKYCKTVNINDNYRYLIAVLNEIKNDKLEKMKVDDILFDQLITKIILILISDYVYKPKNIKKLRNQRSFDNAEIVCTILYELEDQLHLPGHNKNMKNKLSNWFKD